GLPDTAARSTLSCEFHAGPSTLRENVHSIVWRQLGIHIPLALGWRDGAHRRSGATGVRITFLRCGLVLANASRTRSRMAFCAVVWTNGGALSSGARRWRRPTFPGVWLARASRICGGRLLNGTN